MLKFLMNSGMKLKHGEMEPFLIVQGSIFPQGRMQSVMIKGIRPEQSIFKLPSHKLDTLTDAIPAFIGSMTANSARLKIGDYTTMRWRDVNGTFDAAEIVIVEIFSSNVPAAEASQIYIPLEKLWDMMLLPNHATLLTFNNEHTSRSEIAGWTLKPKAELTKQVDDMIKSKTVGQSIMYGILILLAMLAIFDTQVLSIFRRQKEIGTYIALGYTRREVVGLFTVEGTMHAVIAAIVAAAFTESRFSPGRQKSGGPCLLTAASLEWRWHQHFTRFTASGWCYQPYYC
jgi:putative ABC transport system permease protein